MTVTSRSQTRFGKPRLADARSAGRKRSQLQLRYSHPRRADARRSLGRAFVHRKNRFLAGKCSRHNTRAGGVSPPWGLLTRMQQASAHPPSAVRRTGALVSAQTCLPHPLRADARCSLRLPVADRCLIFTARGRLHTPRRADARRSRGRAFVHRKNRFFAGKRSRHNTRAGGVSPPWGLLTRMQQASAHPPSAVRRTGALVSAQTCFPHPRRADARRSCSVFGCAWQIAHFAANERRAPGAAGVSQPWETLRIHRHETRICHNIGA